MAANIEGELYGALQNLNPNQLYHFVATEDFCFEYICQESLPIVEYYGSAPDMGSFEWEPIADLGDLNADGILDIIDVVAMVNTIISLTYDPLGDMNYDGIVDIIDIIALINIILDN